MSIQVERRGAPSDRTPRLLPATGLGWWAVGLAAAFLPLVFAAPVVPMAAALGLVCGLAGGAAAVAAVIRDGERALAVFGALIPLAIAGVFLLVELISAAA